MRRLGVTRLSSLIFLAATVALMSGCGTSSDGGQDADGAETQPNTAEADQTDGEDGEGGDDAESATEELFPDVIEATAELTDDGTWTFSATLSSPYDTPERYADGWRVLGPDGSVYGTRPLAHDHQSEQPFTRTQTGIEIPADVSVVTVQGRDQISGWGGATVEIMLER